MFLALGAPTRPCLASLYRTQAPLRCIHFMHRFQSTFPCLGARKAAAQAVMAGKRA